MSICNVTWTSSGNPIGEPFIITTTSNMSNAGHQIWVGDPPLTGTGDPPWVVPNAPFDPNPAPPWVVPNAPFDPNPAPPFTSSPTITFPPVDEEDEDGNRVVKSPPPSLELILVEIAKVLREGGDILEIREILERHKMKLVDHDGEVIFDPKDVENLEDKGL